MPCVICRRSSTLQEPRVLLLNCPVDGEAYVSILKQADAGVPVKDICRQAGISVPTYYKWKSKYGGLEASELRRVKDLEAENARLKRMYAELALDNAAMKDLIAKKL